MAESAVSGGTVPFRGSGKMMRDKFVATLLGGAVGDALGAPLEFMTAQEIANQYGTAREMMAGGAYDWRCGECTDDTSLSRCVAESLIECKGYNPKDMAQRFLKWSKTEEAKDIGNTTKEALARLESGVKFSASGILKNPTNGSVMRCAPLSLMYVHQEDALIDVSMEVSAITHAHPEAKLSCVFINLMIAKMLLGFDRKAAYDYAAKKVREIDRDFIKQYIGSSYKPEPSKGLAVNTLLLATSSFMKAQSFEETVTKAVNMGGDADTTGAVAGALAGAYFGSTGIPQRWSSVLKPKPAEHFMTLGEQLFKMKIS